MAEVLRVTEIKLHPGFSSVSNYPPLCVNKHITQSLRADILWPCGGVLLPLMDHFKLEHNNTGGKEQNIQSFQADFNVN